MANASEGDFLSDMITIDGMIFNFFSFSLFFGHDRLINLQARCWQIFSFFLSHSVSPFLRRSHFVCGPFLDKPFKVTMNPDYEKKWINKKIISNNKINCNLDTYLEHRWPVYWALISYICIQIPFWILIGHWLWLKEIKNSSSE